MCLSLQQNNPALDDLLTPTCHLPAGLGPSPRHFPKVSVAALAAAPAFQCELEDLGDRLQVAFNPHEVAFLGHKWKPRL